MPEITHCRRKASRTRDVRRKRATRIAFDERARNVKVWNFRRFARQLRVCLLLFSFSLFSFSIFRLLFVLSRFSSRAQVGVARCALVKARGVLTGRAQANARAPRRLPVRTGCGPFATEDRALTPRDPRHYRFSSSLYLTRVPTPREAHYAFQPFSPPASRSRSSGALASVCTVNRNRISSGLPAFPPPSLPFLPFSLRTSDKPRQKRHIKKDVSLSKLYI